MEGKRIPYAVSSTSRIYLPEEVLTATGVFRCPYCSERVILSNIGGVLALKHVRKNPNCVFTRGLGIGEEWKKPAAVFHIFGQVRRAIERKSLATVVVYRKCYSCKGLRPESLPIDSHTVVLEYDPHKPSKKLHPDVAILAKDMRSIRLLFVLERTDLENFEMPEHLRQTPSYVFLVEEVLKSATNALRVERSYGQPSPGCPCQKASKISVARDPANPRKEIIGCPKKNGEMIPLAICRSCAYILGLYKGNVTCGFTVGIRKAVDSAGIGIVVRDPTIQVET